MANLVLKAILGSKNQREVRRLRPLVARINELEEQYQKLSDEEVLAKSLGWKSDLANIDDPDELARRLNDLLPEAFALVKNAARRHWDKTWPELRIKWPRSNAPDRSKSSTIGSGTVSGRFKSDCLNLDFRAFRESRHLNGRTGGRSFREEFSVHFVHCREIVEVG
jgi:hypothetical protein